MFRPAPVTFLLFVLIRSTGATLANPALSGVKTGIHAPEAQRSGVRFKNFFSKTNTVSPPYPQYFTQHSLTNSFLNPSAW